MTPAPKPPASPWRRALRILGWVATACVCGVVFLILRPSDPPPVRRDPGALRRLEGKLELFAMPAGYGQPQTLRLDEPEIDAWVRTNVDVHPRAGSRSGDSPSGVSATPVELRPADATPPEERPLAEILDPRETQMSVEQAQSSVRDIRIHLHGDLLTAYVLFDLYGKDISLELEGHLRAVDGYLHLEPTAIWIGSLRLPQSAIDRAMARLFESPENREHFRLPPEVRDFRIENSTLVIARD